MGKNNSPNCVNCLMYKESISHLFFYCSYVRNFWIELIDMFCKCKSVRIELTCKDVLLFTAIDNENVYKLINIIILYGKSYIYKSKMQCIIPSLISFVKYMIAKIRILRSLNHNILGNEYLQLYEFIDYVTILVY